MTSAEGEALLGQENISLIYSTVESSPVRKR